MVSKLFALFSRFGLFRHVDVSDPRVTTPIEFATADGVYFATADGDYFAVRG